MLETDCEGNVLKIQTLSKGNAVVMWLMKLLPVNPRILQPTPHKCQKIFVNPSEISHSFSDNKCNFQ